MSKSSRNPLKRYPSQESPVWPPGSLVIVLYGDVDSVITDTHIVRTTPGVTYTVEELCELCGEQLKLGPLALQLCSLLTVTNTWLTPNDRVTCPMTGHEVYTFRLRVRPHIRHIEQCTFGVEALDYLFLQVRHDVICDVFTHLESERTLGLGVIDITRYGKERQLPVQTALDLPHKRFLPQSVKKTFSGFKTLSLKSGLKTELKKEYTKGADASIRNFKLLYINGLLEYVPTYMEERYPVDEGKVLIVNHYHSQYPGISLLHTDNQLCGVCRVEDIMDIVLFTSNNLILINLLEGPPQRFAFPSLAAARSFVALVDVYRRLTVDYYFHVCTEVQSPSLLLLKRLHFHGPVNKHWAMIHLQDQNRKLPDVNYLVRQRGRGAAGGFIMLFIQQVQGNKKVIPLAINRLDSSKYQVHLTNEPVFDSLPELLQYYESGKQPIITLHKRLGPSTLKAGDDSGLYLCKPLPQIQEEQEEMEQEQRATRRQQQHANINLVTNINILPQSQLGCGQFTEVHKGFWNKDETNIEVVAVKQLRQNHTHSGRAYQALLEAAHILSFWSHATIVPCIAVSLHPFQVLEEQADLGCLDGYLRAPRQVIYVHHLVTIAEQIAQALLYLQEDATVDTRVHGNIRCRNILVFDHTSENVKVKLGDRGMVALYNGESLNHAYNLERLPWLAPELHGDLSSMSLASDRFAFGMTLWEIFSLGDRPFLHMDYRRMMVLLSNNVPLDSPKKCPHEMYTIMQQCWRALPSDRVAARELVRDIRNINSVMDPLFQSEAESHYNQENLGDLPQQAMVVMREARGEQRGVGDSAGGLLGESTVRLPFSLQGVLTPGGWDLDAAVGGMNTALVQTEVKPGDQPSYAHILKRENLKIESGKQLGQGFFGKVHRGTYNGRVVAVKSLRKTNLTSTSVQEFENEFKLMVKFQHPNIVQIIGQCPGQGQGKPMSLVMEYVENGCLLTYLRPQKSHLPLTTLLRFAEEVALGMNYLSSQKVVHRDLAARNVLVTCHITMKISDFGLSRLLDTQRNYYKSQYGSEMPIKWCAPESQMYFRFSTKSDVWSYGITVWEIFTYGDPPKLCEDRNLNHYLYQGKRLCIPPGCPQPVYHQLMLKCWEYYETQRPDFIQIVSSVTELKQRKVCETGEGGTVLQPTQPPIHNPQPTQPPIHNPQPPQHPPHNPQPPQLQLRDPIQVPHQQPPSLAPQPPLRNPTQAPQPPPQPPSLAPQLI